MLIFAAIAIGGFIFLVGSLIFGGHDHDVSHDAGHDVGDSAGETVSIFSSQVIYTFIMTFGAGGAIGRYYDISYPLSSLIGTSSGLVFAAFMFLMLKIAFKQQSSSIVRIDDAVGKIGTVSTTIGSNSAGEVGLNVNGQFRTYTARSSKEIFKGKQVVVEGVTGGELLVKEKSVA
jgi:membrane protein implicated in regulation of membrane protease activity